MGLYRVHIIGVMRGHARSLDYGSGPWQDATAAFCSNGVEGMRIGSDPRFKLNSIGWIRIGSEPRFELNSIGWIRVGSDPRFKLNSIDKKL